MNAEQVFDCMKHTGVYIVDKENYTTYYENPIACKYSVKERIGKICYEIHGNTSPCSSCPIHRPDNTSFVVREDHNMIFIVQSEEIQWEGKPAYLITVKKHKDTATHTANEQAMSRMGRALEKSVNVYTEINLSNMRYHQINLKDSELYTAKSDGDYPKAFAMMCREEIHPDDVSAVAQIMSPEAFQRVASDSNGPSELSVRYRLKNSKEPRLMQSRAIFLRDELPHYVVSLVTDVTEQTLISEQRNSLSAILNNVDVGIYAIEAKDGKFKIVAANPAMLNMLGRTSAQVIGAGNDDVFRKVHPDDYPVMQRAIDDLMKPNQHITFEYRTKHSITDEYHWLSARGRSIPQADGSIMVYICYIDITEQKKLQNIEQDFIKEKTTSEAKSRFLSTISHDMRTPMNTIINLTHMLKDELDDKETALADLRKIETSNEFLLGLINDVLDMSKIESGKMVLQEGTYNYGDFLNYIHSTFDSTAAVKGVNFTITPGLHNETLRIDKVRFNQICSNLISNAIKYTPAGGHVDFTLIPGEAVDNTIPCTIVVSDNGIGMTTEFQEKLFKPFEQEGRAYNAVEGTGLGLSIVNAILKAMGATIEVSSQLNAGTTFTIHLNLTLAPDDSAQSKKDTDLSVLQGRHILLVEDHPLNQMIAKRLLEKKDMVVDIAVNGQDGVTQFQKNLDYDAILMDLRMPIMDGLTATKTIRELDLGDAKTIPIIAMTANAFDTDKEDCKKAGMNAHLSKPIDPTKLYETLARYIQIN